MPIDQDLQHEWLGARVGTAFFRLGPEVDDGRVGPVAEIAFENLGSILGVGANPVMTA